MTEILLCTLKNFSLCLPAYVIAVKAADKPNFVLLCINVLVVTFKIFLNYMFFSFTKICLDVALILCMLLEIWHFEYEDSYTLFFMENMELLFFK